MPPDAPIGSPPGPDVQFQRHLAAGRLQLQQCSACGHWVFFPRLLCPRCGSSRLDWHPVSGRGTVHAATVIQRGSRHGEPHLIVLVDLEEGPRIMSQLPGTPAEQVAIGMAVRARIERQADQYLVVFDPVPAA